LQAFTLNALLSKRRPTTLNSSWILRHAPACYRFIRKWIRTEVGGIDWDQVTYILDSTYQRQEQAVRALIEHDTGVFVAPPGIGKTVVGTYLVAARKRSTLILIHRKPLLDQWLGQLAMFLGIEPKDIGQISAGKTKPNGRLDVAMVQSLVRKGAVADLVAGYGQVIQDEAHHCPAVSFERVLAEVKNRFVVGPTATPQRRDGHQPILHMQLGPVRFSVDAKCHAARRPFDLRLVVRETGFLPAGLANGAGIQDFYASLAADQKRNDLIFDDVVQSGKAQGQRIRSCGGTIPMRPAG
jgi:hypothetical protein